MKKKAKKPTLVQRKMLLAIAQAPNDQVKIRVERQAKRMETVGWIELEDLGNNEAHATITPLGLSHLIPPATR